MPKRFFFPAIVILLVSALTWPQRSAAQANAPAASECAGCSRGERRADDHVPALANRPLVGDGQFNTIFQAHPEFHAAYSGTNSFHAQGEHATSLLETLYSATCWDTAPKRCWTLNRPAAAG